MGIDQRILPTPEMIRAARGYLNWSQHELGLRCNLSKVSLVGIEAGRQHPNHETLKRISEVFWDEGLMFLPEGGFSVSNQIFKVLDGEDSYMSLLPIIQRDIDADKNIEVLYLGGDEKKSSKEVIDLEKKIIKSAKGVRSIIEEGNSTFYGPIENYRWTSSDSFITNDVAIIFGDKVAFCTSGEDSRNNKGPTRIFIIKDSYIANSQRRIFEKTWDNSKEVLEQDPKCAEFSHE